LERFPGILLLAVLLLRDMAVIPLLALVPLLAVPELTIGADIALALAEANATVAYFDLGGTVRKYS